MRRLSTLLLVIPLTAAFVVPVVAQSPTRTEELLAGMVIEEIEPGVFRVIDDDVHDLRPDIDFQEQGFPSHFVDVAPDGGVWLSGGGHLDDGLYRLGDDRSYEDGGDAWGANRRARFAPDGTLWAHSGDTVRTFADGDSVVRRLHDLHVHDLAPALDRGAWVVAEDDDREEGPRRSVLKLGTTPDADDLHRWIDGWAGLVDGFNLPESIEVAPDGSVWLLGASPSDVWLLRFADQRWAVVDAPTSLLRGSELRDLAAGSDGSLWLVGTGWRNEGPQRGPALARLDRDGWSTFDAMEVGSGWGQGVGLFGSYLLDVAPDGALWLSASKADPFEHAGVARFDGVTWQRFLDGHSVHDLDVGPDGAVWVRAAHNSAELPDAVELYVITPEAVAGTE